jgi:hypothetical protein
MVQTAAGYDGPQAEVINLLSFDIIMPLSRGLAPIRNGFQDLTIAVTMSWFTPPPSPIPMKPSSVCIFTISTLVVLPRLLGKVRGTHSIWVIFIFHSLLSHILKYTIIIIKSITSGSSGINSQEKLAL